MEERLGNVGNTVHCLYIQKQGVNQLWLKSGMLHPVCGLVLILTLFPEIISVVFSQKFERFPDNLIWGLDKTVCCHVAIAVFKDVMGMKMYVWVITV